MIRFCLILIAVFSLLAACAKQKEMPQNTMVRQLLEEGITPPPSEPFGIREFLQPLDLRAVSYGPYRKGQAPGGASPTEVELEEDLTLIANYWHLIRVYNADDLSENMLSIIDENTLPIRVMLGIWLEKEAIGTDAKLHNIDNTLRAIELANRYKDIVVAVSVGNETQVEWSAHRMNPENLIRYIRTVRNNIQQPVTSADDYNFWNKKISVEIADEIDFITMHMHPLWNGRTLATTAEWLSRTLDAVQSMHQRPVIVGETGWATDYNANRKGTGEQGTLVKGEVSVEGQQDFLMLLDRWIEENQTTTFLFEAFDEPWKGSGEHDIENNWGVFYEDRTPKSSFKAFQEHIDNGTLK